MALLRAISGRVALEFLSLTAAIATLIENAVSVAVRDKYPVTDWHILVVPKRHTPDYFDLGTAESRACHRLIMEARSLVCKADPAVMGFNMGFNSGEVAGQTVMHCHVHLIPRRTGDHPNPRGGVRAVIPSKGTTGRCWHPG